MKWMPLIALAVLLPASWDDRLEGLDPAEPMAYFELAEEIADASTDTTQVALARHLFALSGVLDPLGLGRSAALALADLEANPHARRRLAALAAILDTRAGRSAWDELAGPTRIDRVAALAVAEAVGHYRRGQGGRAEAALRATGALELLEQYGSVFRGGADRFLEDCKLYRGPRRPMLTDQDIRRQLRFERALLAGADRSWSDELLLTGGRPLIEVDPDRLAETLGVDPGKACYRDGEWRVCR